MVRIRLARRGRKKLAIFDIIVANSRSPRDGRFIEKIGTYNPNTNPATINLDEAKALQWLINGAQPSPTVKAMLSYLGVLYKKHLQIGVIKGAITQEQADARYSDWKAQKEAKITQKVDSLAAKKAAEQKARLDAEKKVNEARAEALRKKQQDASTQVSEEAPVVETTDEASAETAE
jgi:small subunit ribosomal protein S16